MSRIYGAVGVAMILDGGIDTGCQGTADIPGVKFTAQDYKGPGIMGTMALPTTGMIEDMQLKISTRGMSKEAMRLQAPGEHELELRLKQDSYMAGSGQGVRLSKVFVNGMFVEGENGAVEMGSVIEGSATYAVYRLQIIENGEELLLIDKFAHQYRVLGKDYGANIWGDMM